MRTFQVARVFANLSVRENLLVPFLAAGSPGGVREGLARAAELLAARHAGASGREPAGVLSGGQRMLLQACAGFMIPAVRLYVLDEPFAGINPVVKDTLIDLIQRENKASGQRLPDRQPRDGDRAAAVSARDGDDPGRVAAEGYARRGGPAAGGGRGLSRKRRGMTGKIILEAQGIHAGYVPGVDILRGLSVKAALDATPGTRGARRPARARSRRSRCGASAPDPGTAPAGTRPGTRPHRKPAETGGGGGGP